MRQALFKKMRSIGKRNRNLVRKMTIVEISKQKDEKGIDGINYHLVEQNVINDLPEALWNTWEMADQEIMGIINATIENL